MTFKKIILILTSLFFLTSGYCQSKKDIRNAKVATETTTTTITDNGKEITYKDSYTVFDKNGNVNEQTEYNKDGTIKRKESNKYNASNDKIEEKIFDAKDKSTKKTTFTYDVNKNKTGETEYDENGTVIRQVIYSYNNKGLKTEKKTYDGKKKLISTKKYTYTNR